MFVWIGHRSTLGCVEGDWDSRHGGGDHRPDSAFAVQFATSPTGFTKA